MFLTASIEYFVLEQPEIVSYAAFRNLKGPIGKVVCISMRLVCRDYNQTRRVISF